MLVAARGAAADRAPTWTGPRGALAPLAGRHRDTPMAGRTLAQHAVPTTFGLKAAGWRQLAAGPRPTAVRALAGGLPVPLGGAAGTLAGYLEYAGAERYDPDGRRRAYADVWPRLRGRRPAWPSRSLPVARPARPGRRPGRGAGRWSPAALGKIAVDVLALTRTEVGEVAEPAAAGRGGSSAMPHKRNPVLATLIRSAALQVRPLAAVLAQCCSPRTSARPGPGTPSGSRCGSACGWPAAPRTPPPNWPRA